MDIVINFIFQLYFPLTAELILKRYTSILFLSRLKSHFSRHLFNLPFDNKDKNS